MRKTKSFVPLLACLVTMLALAWGAGTAWGAEDQADVNLRLQRAATTLEHLTDAPDQGIPNEVFETAKCIAVVPNMTKGGFIFAAKRGRGVATCRLPNGNWSAPDFFTITGGSWGAQLGVEDIHLVMMIMNTEGMKQLLTNKFQVGGSASASAGPVGRHASAGTDWKADTEILTYSRSKGLFAGIDLGGSWIQRDKDATVAAYGRDYSNSRLLTGDVKPPEAARAFLNEVATVKTEARAQH